MCCGHVEVMMFRVAGKEYFGASALEIVHALQEETLEHTFKSSAQFIRWSLIQLIDRIPVRELDVSDKLSDEVIALNYLYLRDECGAGELVE
jgi:hypothetical protein